MIGRASLFEFLCSLNDTGPGVEWLAVDFVQIYVENGHLLVLIIENDDSLDGVLLKPDDCLFSLAELADFFRGEVVSLQREDEFGVEIEVLVVELDQLVDDDRGGQRTLENGDFDSDGLDFEVDVEKRLAL